MPSVVIDTLDQAARSLSENPDQAERIARALVVNSPGDPRPRLILASALRRLGRNGEALTILDDLVRAFPKAARTRYELGLVLTAQGRGPEGERHLAEAVRLDGNHLEAWQALKQVAFSRGDHVQEAVANAAIARIEAGGGELGHAAELVELGRHAQAEPFLRTFCLAQPKHPEALRLLAACHIANRAPDLAETLLRHALSLAPKTSARIRFDLAHALYTARLGEKALEELGPLLDAEPDSVAYRTLQAACLGLLGDDQGAEAIQAELARAWPENARIAVNHGHAARTAGERDVAIAAYRRATALSPEAGEPWWGLANLKIGVLSDSDEARMRELLANRLPDAERMRIA